jgi:hypothetical protein
MSKQSIKQFEQNANAYAKEVEKIGAKVQRMCVIFLNTLETKDGKLLPSTVNLGKVLQFQNMLKQFIEDVGYDDLVDKFISDVPALIRKA